MQRGFKFSVWLRSVWGGEARGQVRDVKTLITRNVFFLFKVGKMKKELLILFLLQKSILLLDFIALESLAEQT